MTHQELIAAIARDAIAAVSPSELPIFPAVQRAYFQRGGAAVISEGETDLGFGLGAEVTALAPAALAVATSVFSFAATQIGETAV
jgi:hypothetical protein